MSEVPSNLHYTKTHEWVRIEGNMLFVGITDFAQEALTEVMMRRGVSGELTRDAVLQNNRFDRELEPGRHRERRRVPGVRRCP